MSYILDALRKSELARRSPDTSPGATHRTMPTTQTKTADPVRRQRSDQSISRWYWALGCALAINGGITLYHHNADSRHQASSSQSISQVVTSEATGPRLIAPTVLSASPRQEMPVRSDPKAPDDAGDVSLLREKSAAFRNAVPKMTVDLHVYTERPSERFALINMSKFREGDEIAPRLILEQITPTGVIVSFNSEPFRINTRL